MSYHAGNGCLNRHGLCIHPVITTTDDSLHANARPRLNRTSWGGACVCFSFWAEQVERNGLYQYRVHVGATNTRFTHLCGR